MIEIVNNDIKITFIFDFIHVKMKLKELTILQIFVNM